jgi:hypothetical protein
VNATIVRSSLPSQLLPIVEQWIEDIIGGGGSSTSEVEQNLLLLLQTESPICVAVPYVYDEDSRSCTDPTPIDAQDIDVSSYGLCEDLPVVGQHCVQTVSILAEITPDLTWPSSFATFSGTEEVGSAQNPAEMTVVVSGSLGGTYDIEFYASRDVAGARCDNCNTCPPAPGGPSPNGAWDVTSTNVSVTVTNSTLPGQLTPFVEQWIAEVISNGGSSECSVAQATVVLSRTETEMCAPMVYVYDPISRRCMTTTPVDVRDVDLSALNICQDVVLDTYCLTKISLDADFTPNLQWASDFGSFSGSELIGSVRNPASAEITITGAGLGGNYNVDFYSSRNVSGTRCTGCTPCR